MGKSHNLKPRIQAGIILYVGLPINNLWKWPPLTHILVTSIPPDIVTHQPALGSNVSCELAKPEDYIQRFRQRKACTKALESGQEKAHTPLDRSAMGHSTQLKQTESKYLGLGTKQVYAPDPTLSPHTEAGHFSS